VNPETAKLVYTSKGKSGIISSGQGLDRTDEVPGEDFRRGKSGWIERSFRLISSDFEGLLLRKTRNERLAMTAKLAETQLWQHNLASLIRSGLFLRAETGEFNGLFTVVGIYKDETCSAPMAKYSDARRAMDAANLVNQLAKPLRSPESN
jgi:hypothetical protein